MSLRTQVQTDVDTLLMNENDHAVEVTYTPVTGVATTPIVLPQGGLMGVEEVIDGSVEAKQQQFQVSKTDLSAPAQGDAITYDGTVWKVEEWQETSAWWMLTCVRTDEEEIAGDGYRTG